MTTCSYDVSYRPYVNMYTLATNDLLALQREVTDQLYCKVYIWVLL
jgi:hypothetical protein